MTRVRPGVVMVDTGAPFDAAEGGATIWGVSAVNPSPDEDRPFWSIMTKSYGGKVSVIRDLTLAQVRGIYERLDPWYGVTMHPDENGQFSASRTLSDGDIEIKEVFGPPGWDGSSVHSWQRWPMVEGVERSSDRGKG